MPKSEISWDLSELFPSTTDPAVHKAIDTANKMAMNLERNYHGRIKDFSARELLTCIREFETFLAKLEGISLFAGLSFAANMTLPETQSLYDNVKKAEAEIGKMLAFFELEVGQLVHGNRKIVSDKILTSYRHFLERLSREVPHQLSEIEEQLIIEKDQFGIRAWQDLQSKWLNTRLFEARVEGKKKTFSYGETNGLLPHPDRKTRESANISIYRQLGEDGEIFSAALRSICNDWVTVCKRRKYDSFMHASFIANDTDRHIIDNLLKAVESHVNLYRRYLRLKAKMMKLPKLGCHDIVAPLPDAPKMEFDYEKAKNLVIEAYNAFDKEYACSAKDMFDRNHLDPSLRFGKQNGAWCSSWYSGKTAFILNNFNGSLSDVYTMAHEIGHATHDYYWQQNQTILNGRIPMIVAETASTFGELLLTDLLLIKSKSDKEKQAIICHVLDEAGMAAFQVTARVWFEQNLYEAIEKGEYLGYKTICKLWTAARNRIYGNSVKWFKEMDAEWTMKPHYYIPNFRFYNYPYVYGQMFVYALYNMYRKEGKRFVPKFKKILSAGSSMSPIEIGRVVGVDLAKADFWNLGLEQLGHFVQELENSQTGLDKTTRALQRRK
jgi:oligoendopeptidase F